MRYTASLRGGVHKARSAFQRVHPGGSVYFRISLSSANQKHRDAGFPGSNCQNVPVFQGKSVPHDYKVKLLAGKQAQSLADPGGWDDVKISVPQASRSGIRNNFVKRNAEYLLRRHMDHPQAATFLSLRDSKITLEPR